MRGDHLIFLGMKAHLKSFRRLTGDFRTQNQVKLGKPSQMGGLKSYPVFPTLRLGNGFYKEKVGSGPSIPFPTLKNSQPKGGRGLGKLGRFPKFYPVLNSEVSPKDILQISLAQYFFNDTKY